MPSASGSAIALGRQAAKGTAQATEANLHLFHHDEFGENAGRILDQGRPVIGGGYFSPRKAAVYGIRQRFAGFGELQLTKAHLHLLQASGFVAGAPSGAAAASVIPFTPITAEVNFPWYTFDVNYDGGAHVALRDCRVGLLSHEYRPDGPPLVRYQGLGIVNDASVATVTNPPAIYVPTPAETVAAANRKFFGTNDYAIFGFVFTIRSLLDNTRNPMGSATPLSVNANGGLVQATTLLPLTANDYYRMTRGVTSSGPAGVLVATGEMNMRVETGEAVESTNVGYYEYAFSNAQYFMPDDADFSINPLREQLIPVTCVPMPGATVSITAKAGIDNSTL